MAKLALPFSMGGLEHSLGILLLRLSSGIKVDPGIGVAVMLRQGDEMWQAISLRTPQHPAIFGIKTGLQQC